MGQVFCCLDEKRRFYYNQRGLANPSKFDDDEEEARDISMRKDDGNKNLRLTGSHQGGFSEAESTSNDIFAIDKRPH